MCRRHIPKPAPRDFGVVRVSVPRPREAKLIVDKNTLIPLEDGTQLAADVHRPATDAPVPVLMQFVPYHKDDFIGASNAHARQRFVDRGYAVALVDFRGAGGSDGVLWPTFDAVREGIDGAAAVEWLADRDWCSGKVGVWGWSYGGVTTLDIAARRPAHLAACMVGYGSPDLYLDFISPGGIPSMIGNSTRETFMLAMDLMPPTHQDPDGRWERVWHERLTRLERGDLWSLAWQRHPDRDEHWRHRNIEPDLEDVTTPTLLIGGWNDVLCDGTVRAYERLAGPRELVVGPWVHTRPDTAAVAPWDWIEAAADWWDRWLLDDAEPARPSSEPAVTVYVRGADAWEHEDDWPPPEMAERVLHLGPSGALGEEPAGSDGADRYAGEPTVGVHGAMYEPMGTGAGYPRSLGPDELRSLRWTTAPLEDDLDIAGAAAVVVHVEVVDGADLDLVAKLSDVAPDGTSTLIATGWLNGRHRRGHDTPTLVEPGPHEYTVRLWNSRYRVRAGHRLRLSLACADFPHSFPTATMPTIDVHHGPARPSRVLLPVIDATREPRPADMPAHEPSPAATPWTSAQEAHHVVTDDVLAGSVSVSYGARMAIDVPEGPALGVRFAGDARVRRDRPDGAHVAGRANIDVDLPDGRHVEVWARSHITRTTMRMAARVTMDEVTILDRAWSNVDGDAG